MQTHAVIKTISVTEKSTDQTEFLKYTFIVDRRANKQDVKRAVEELFEREVEAVNTQNRLGKVKRNRFGLGKKADWKKAIVTLKAGQEPLEFF
tara:strand:+ start:174 stop:452 length:279 start_codon:yes stop_codon:yes gene_type:complete